MRRRLLAAGISGILLSHGSPGAAQQPAAPATAPATRQSPRGRCHGSPEPAAPRRGGAVGARREQRRRNRPARDAVRAGGHSCRAGRVRFADPALDRLPPHVHADRVLDRGCQQREGRREARRGRRLADRLQPVGRRPLQRGLHLGALSQQQYQPPAESASFPRRLAQPTRSRCFRDASSTSSGTRFSSPGAPPTSLTVSSSRC